ncbi:MAG TPA: signal recognition particle protein [Victivallales bacterium]|nr:signal recognition particle protein [Victivallales bacterium]
MFENLTSRLRETIRKISGQAVLTESNMREALEEIKSALIDADVNQRVAEDFVEDLRKNAIGTEVLKTVSPGQQIVKVVYDKLVEMMGEKESPLELKSYPAAIMVVGLHGSGKTTSCAKIASQLIKKGRKPLLAACDIYRPAAIDQLEILSNQVSASFYCERSGTDAVRICSEAVKKARNEGCDTVIIDSAGRHQIDHEMVMELVRMKQSVNPDEIILVADSALGQESVSVARHFNDALGISGVILTKLDGDARGGAALSIRKVVGCPIKFVGIGEKISDLEPFYPDRMASRILGMGDIVSLVEKAAEDIDKEEAERMQKKLLERKFDLDDLLSQIKQMKKMGGLESVMSFLPGADQLAGVPDLDDGAMSRMEAQIRSMTKEERSNPDIIDFSRKKRISRGSGSSMEDLNKLLEQFKMMRTFMKNTSMMKKLLSGLSPSSLMGALGGGGASPFRRGSNYTPPKKKRKK